MIQNSGKVYEDIDKQAIQEWLDSGEEIPWGTYYDRFEKELAKYIGTKYAIFVNSGSSANLIAFATMFVAKKLQPGDEIITLAASFPTTVAPIVQYGCVPVFVDIDIPSYQINIEEMKKALSPKTKGIFIAHTLGNLFDVDAVKEFCKENNLFLIEDACDAMGSVYKEGMAGSFGDIATTSFYPAHEMTTGGGGAVFTSDPELYKTALSLTRWGKACVCPPNKDGICGSRFTQQHGELPFGYDHKFVFSNFGYNLMSTNMQAALGLAQLSRLDRFTETRHTNFDYLYRLIFSSPLIHKILLPQELPFAYPSWFGFPLLVESGKRNDLSAFLNKNGVGTRNLFAGNLLKQPLFTDNNVNYRVVGDLRNTDRVMNDLLWVGCWHGLTTKDMQYIYDQLRSFYGV